jgi:hypothetical protein
MGCWDIFCFLCGNTCHGPLNGIEENLIENIEYFESIKDSKNKKKKWFIDDYSEVYKNYKKNPKIFLDKLKKINKNTQWLDKCTFLAADGSINHHCEEGACNISFGDYQGNSFIHQTFFKDFNEHYGLFVHTDCWKYIQKEHKIKLSYKHLPINKVEITENKVFDFVDYGKIEKYWAQDFDFIKIISDGNEELCNSPLKSKTVGNNIKKVFNKLKIRKDEDRQSPPVSATFYKEGIYRIGNNGNIWFIKNGKWNELKNTITYEINNLKSIKYISYYEDINTKPFFVKLVNKKLLVISVK